MEGLETVATVYIHDIQRNLSSVGGKPRKPVCMGLFRWAACIKSNSRWMLKASPHRRMCPQKPIWIKFTRPNMEKCLSVVPTHFSGWNNFAPKNNLRDAVFAVFKRKLFACCFCRTLPIPSIPVHLDGGLLFKCVVICILFWWCKVNFARNLIFHLS